MFPAARKDDPLVTKAWQFIQQPIEGVSFHEVLHVPRDHGVITETYRPEWDPSGLPLVQVYQSRLYPGAIGAWSCHARTVDRLFVNHGHLKIVLYDGREEGPTHGRIMELHAGDARPTFLHIPIGVGPTDALMLNYPSRAYDYEDPDHFRLPWNATEIPYRWVADVRTRLRSDHD